MELTCLQEGQLQNDDQVRIADGRDIALTSMNYYLTYLHDGMVGADHIDFDIPLDASDPWKQVCVMFKSADTAPPLSPEGAKKLLGME